jgi:hypothetical protein
LWLAAIISILFSSTAFAQMYGDPALVRPDTAKHDTAAAVIPQEIAPETQAATLPFDLAKLWIRRVLLRGVLNTNQIGGLAEYQLTDWSPESGSMGPIKLSMKVVYLGSADFNGQDAEWVQAVVMVFGETDKRIAFDFVLPTDKQRSLPLRALAKEDDAPLREISFAVSSNSLDYDATDNPSDMSEEVVELSHGKYLCHHFRGSGANGEPVDLFLSSEVKPFGIVVMGYGNQGLTLIRKGADATPLLEIPTPLR